MLARIDSIGLDVASGYVYTVVSYLPGVEAAPVLINDFLIDVLQDHWEIATDAFGRYLTVAGHALLPQEEINGMWHSRTEDLADPWQRVHVDLDQSGQIIDPILSWGARNRSRTGDLRDPNPRRLAPVDAELAALAGRLLPIPD